MNTFLTIVLAVLLTVFVASVAIAEDQSCAAGGLAFNQPSVTISPSDRIAPEVWAGPTMFLACNEQ